MMSWTRPHPAHARCPLRRSTHVSCDDDVERPAGTTHPTWLQHCDHGGRTNCLRRRSTICLIGDSLMRQTFIEMACDAASWGKAARHDFELRNKLIPGSTARKVYVEPRQSFLPSNVTMVYIPQSTIPRPRNGSFAYGNVDSKDRRMKKLLRAKCTTVIVGWGAWHVQRFPLSPAAYGSALHEAVLGLRRALGAHVRLLLLPTLAQATTTNYSFRESALLHQQLREQHAAVAARCESQSADAGSGAWSGTDAYLARPRLAWKSPSQRTIRHFNAELDRVARALGVEVVGGSAAVLYNLTAARPCLHVRMSSRHVGAGAGAGAGAAARRLPLDPTHWCTWEATANPALLAVSVLLR